MAAPTSTADLLLGQFLAAAAAIGGVRACDNLLGALSAARDAAAEGWRDVAVGLIRAGYGAEAIRLLEAALKRFPRSIDLRYCHGNALRMGGRNDLAEINYRDVLRHDPRHRDAALSLAFMLRENGRTNAAADAMAASLRARDGDAAETQETLGFLRECGAYARAHALARAARARWPEDANIAALAGEFALAVGEFALAADDLRAALKGNPRKSASWLRLAYCKHYATRDDEDLARLRVANADASLDSTTRTCVGFALGKALDDVGDFAGAAAALRGANASAHAATPWDEDAWRRFVKAKVAAAPLPQPQTGAQLTPVFVVGLPRTGTTLAATLLARDLGVRDRGELNWIDAMHRHLAEHGQLVDAGAIASAAALVARQMRRDDEPAPFYLDKNPLNFRYLDLIAAMFPQAKIIHCRRGARDTAFSIWMQYFAHEDMGFAYDFASIAAFAGGHDRLMAHWRNALPLPIFDLEYEALVADVPRVTAELGGFLGAGGTTPAAARSPSAIATASVWQARQPVYASSVGRWRRYAEFVPELGKLFPE